MKVTPQAPAIAAGCDHGEAFCHMHYGNADRSEVLHIWNSRDGVTPFIIISPVTGHELSHLPPWAADRFDPHYVPQVDEWVFIDLDPEKAMQHAMRKVELWWDHEQYPLCEQGMTKIEAAQMFLEDMLYVTHPGTGERREAHSPDLVQVTGPLADRIAIEVRERFEKRTPIDWSSTIPAGGGRFA